MEPKPNTETKPIPWNGTNPAMADFLLTFDQVAQEAIDGIPDSEHQQDFFSGSTYGDC